MAAMVARGNSQISSLSLTENGSRNKRKFRADTPQADSIKVEFPPEMGNLSPSYDSYGRWDICSLHQEQLNSFVAELRQSSSYFDKGLQGQEEFQDADWGDDMENVLEELMLNNLDMIFRSAVRRIASYGYNEEFASRAVLRSGVCYGYKDAVSNIVDNTLSFLSNGHEMDSSVELFFADLQQLERYLLAEMVCVLKEVRPFFSTGDAMWCLLICDMNVSHACAVDINQVYNAGNVHITSSLSSTSEFNNASTVALDANSLKPTGSNHLVHSCSLSETPAICSLSSLSQSQFSASGAQIIPKGEASQQEKLACVQGPARQHFDIAEESSKIPLSLTPLTDEKHEKFTTCRKTHTNSLKKDAFLRQRTVHFEKSYRAYGSKAALRSGKISAFGGLVLDKKGGAVPDTVVAGLNSNSLIPGEVVGAEEFRAEVSNAHSSCDMMPSLELGPESPVEAMPLLPHANTNLSVPLSPKNNSPIPNHNFGFEPLNRSSEGFSSNNIFGPWVPQYRKDEIILQLVPRIRELQNHLQEWTEWAQQKVMQAARRLNKDKAELKILKEEKEEVARLKKEKQALEESTMKKLSEMENALCKASGQVERANIAVRRLEVENAELSREMEAAKQRAVESAASFQEVSRREKKTLKKYQSWEKQKDMFQEELLTEKRKLLQIKSELDQAKELQNQLEARFRQEETMKEGALLQAESERKEREQIEAWARSREEMMRLKSEHYLQRYREDIHKLESEISQLRLQRDSSKIAALRWDLDGGPLERKSGIHPKETDGHDICETTKFHSMDNWDVRREWECVMCLTDEISVVFLPCAHQVVCVQCNELHEKQGMGDCPSCRAHIQRRVCALFAGH